MRRRTHVAVLTGCLLLAGLVAAPPASADKIGDLKAQAARLSKQTQALHEDAERLAEQQNAVQVELDELAADVGALETKLVAQSDEISTLNTKLSQFAISTYKYGDLTTGLTTVIGSVGNEAGQREGYSSVILGGANDVTDQMKAVREDTTKLQKDLLAKQAKQAKLQTSLAQKIESIAKKEKQIKALQESTSVELRAAIIEHEREVAAREAREFAARQKAIADNAAADAARRAAQPGAANTPAAGASPGTTARPRAGSPTPPVARNTPTTKAPPKQRPAPPPPPPVSGAAGRAVSAAYSQIGVPYQFATASPGVSFDCSGLTSWAWSQAGVSIPRTSQAQWAGLPHVSLDQIQPGDLIFYYSDVHHVSIYVGNGTVIHAPFTGSTVSLAPLRGQIIGAARPG
jgi:peptidoglycan DL-endopeptidase CwlO